MSSLTHQLLDARLNSMPTNCLEGIDRAGKANLVNPLHTVSSHGPGGLEMQASFHGGKKEGGMNTKEKRAPRCCPDEAKLLLT